MPERRNRRDRRGHRRAAVPLRTARPLRGDHPFFNRSLFEPSYSAIPLYQAKSRVEIVLFFELVVLGTSRGRAAGGRNPRTADLLWETQEVRDGETQSACACRCAAARAADRVTGVRADAGGPAGDGLDGGGARAARVDRSAVRSARADPSPWRTQPSEPRRSTRDWLSGDERSRHDPRGGGSGGTADGHVRRAVPRAVDHARGGRAASRGF
jgi:hypothetical protein